MEQTKKLTEEEIPTTLNPNVNPKERGELAKSDPKTFAEELKARTDRYENSDTTS